MNTGTTHFRKHVAVAGNLTVGGTALVDGEVNDDLTIVENKTLAVTTANKLTVGGKVIPQTFTLTFSLPGTSGATAGNYGVFAVLPVAAKIVGVTERHATAGSDGSAVTAMVKKVPSGTAVAAGTDCLSAGISLKATADTNQAGSLHATAANYTFAAGNAVGVALAGTPTAVAGVVIAVEFEWVP